VSPPKPPGRDGRRKGEYRPALLRCAYCGRPRKMAVCRYCSDLPLLEQALLQAG
jgi:hypothetical protein